MKFLLTILLLSLAAQAQTTTTSPFTLYLHDTTGKSADTPLPSTYQLPTTAEGNSSPIVIKLVNTSSNNTFISVVLMSTASNSSTANSNFSVTGFNQFQLLVPGASVLFTVNFAPSTTGQITGFLTLAYQLQQNGCALVGQSGTQCPGNTTSVSTFTGTATAPQLTLSYLTTSGAVPLAPSSASPLNFPDTAECSTSSITFALSNQSSIPITVPPILATGSFSVNATQVPQLLPAGQTVDFIVNFIPSQQTFATGNLEIGANVYPIQGQGTQAITTSYSVNSTTTIATYYPVAGSTITFPQVLPGSGASSVLTFSLTNPATATTAFTVSGVTITGSAFSLAGLPAFPASIPVGGSPLTFKVLFTPNAVGSYNGTLTIGCLTYNLAGVGQGLSNNFPTFNLTTAAPVASREQTTVTVNLSAPSPVTALGTLTMTFTPSVANVTNDAAVVFTATNGRQLNIGLAAGAQQATYNGQTAIPFATGTTAGTITFSVAFPATQTYAQQFTIPAATPQLTSVTANRESPNLLVSVNGYDNTYTAGPLSFTFYDTSGKVIGNTITVNAQTDFSRLFYGGNADGGLFALNASFPVTGDVTKVGSVAVSVSNSAGQSTQTVAFQ